ncbi:MAG: glucose-6-phosphate isomerase [Clostridia bacterium]|nr:glucose-6-phosphate isomerase [Clostridia bacterium]
MSNVRNNIFRLETPDIEIAPAIREGYETLINGTGAGAEMRGWMNWPAQYLKSEEYARLKETAKKIIEEFKHTIVIGIGGSYLGAKSIIDAKLGTNFNEIYDVPGRSKVHFVASLSSKEWRNIGAIIGNDPFCIIYISKSGTTLEPGLALRYFYELHKTVHGAEPTVFAITDREHGTGRKLTNDHGWESFVIPDNIGGRYSVFTPVGLLPIAVAGIDTDILLKAAAEASELFMSTIDNPAVHYANWRYHQYINGYSVEFMNVNNPELRSFAEWWKQLFGESEGKSGQGLCPNSAVFSMDLHSLGQYLQQGLRKLVCETFFTWDDSIRITFPKSSLEDGLDYLAGRKLTEVNHAAMKGSFTAHSSIGDEPNPCCNIFCPAGIGSIAYAKQTFEYACAISSYAIEVNPFDQPGVEDYKNEVKQILFRNSANNS